MVRKKLDGPSFKLILKPDQRQRIEALVGNYGIAAFIREAVDNELDRREARPAGDSKAGEEG